MGNWDGDEGDHDDDADDHDDGTQAHRVRVVVITRQADQTRALQSEAKKNIKKYAIAGHVPWFGGKLEKPVRVKSGSLARRPRVAYTSKS